MYILFTEVNNNIAMIAIIIGLVFYMALLLEQDN